MSDSQSKSPDAPKQSKKSKWFSFGKKETTTKEDPQAVQDQSTDREPSAGREPSAVGEPSADKEPFANKEPLANPEPFADKPSLIAEEPLDRAKTSSKAPAPAKVEDGLEPSRQGLWSKLGQVFKGTFDLDDELFDELEETLMTCDIGVQASLALVDSLRERVTAEKIHDKRGVLNGLRQEVYELLKVAEAPWQLNNSPQVILVVGVNGVGKTTTTAKMANHLKSKGHEVMLAAADTFRAAAVAQLQEWGERLDIPVISQGQGADAAAVAHDALIAAKARGCDILMIDTAGRLHTQSDLMEQLGKVVRVLKKIDPDTPHDVIQVLDAGTGQNALSQLDHFRQAVDVNGLCLTKLDGSAKGGVALSLIQQHKLPIRFIGVGEGANDLQEFSARQFSDALIAVK